MQRLDITTIAGCHTPVLEGPLIEQALDPPPRPNQSVLDQIIAARRNRSV